MLKKFFEIKKTVTPVAVYKNRFEDTTEAEVNANQTPVAWGVETQYRILGKTRRIPLTNTMTETYEVYGDE